VCLAPLSGRKLDSQERRPKASTAAPLRLGSAIQEAKRSASALQVLASNSIVITYPSVAHTENDLWELFCIPAGVGAQSLHSKTTAGPGGSNLIAVSRAIGHA